MADTVTVKLVLAEEHAKNRTGYGTYCIPNKPAHLGWERKHYFIVSNLSPAASKALAQKQLMVKMEGKVFIYKWTEPKNLDEIEPIPGNEVFKVLSGNKTKPDSHFRGTQRVPPYCGWWGLGMFTLSLVSAKWKDEETAKKFAKMLGKSQPPNEAPEFAHNNPAGTSQGMENQPTYDDIKMEAIGGGEGGKLEYAYLPIHCGDKTITQQDANDKKKLQEELNKYKDKGGNYPTNLEDILKLRSKSGVDGLVIAVGIMSMLDQRAGLVSVLGPGAMPAASAGAVCCESCGDRRCGSDETMGMVGVDSVVGPRESVSEIRRPMELE